MSKTEVAQYKEKVALWKRSFVDWSTSEFGFYVSRRPDPSRKRKWIYEDAPVVWQPHQERVFRYLLTMDETNHLPFSDIWYLDVGQTGKSLFQAAVAQWCGMFHERDAEVQIAANSKDQAGLRVFSALTKSIKKHPRAAEIADLQGERIEFYDTHNLVRPLPLKASTQAGGTAVFRGFDEIWDYEGPRATVFFDEIKESPASEISLMVVTTYPCYEDSDGPLNLMISKYFNDDDTPNGILEQPFEDLPLYVNHEDRFAVYWNHDALLYPWHSQAFLDRKRRAPGATDSGYRRIWMCNRASREETFMPMESWDACEDDELEPLEKHGRSYPMILSVDLMGGKVYSDCAAVVARGYDPVTQRYILYNHKIWDPRKIGNKDFDYNEAVEAWILDMANRHHVLAVYYDPYQFVGSAKKLARAGVEMVEVTQNTMRATADTHYRDLIRNKRLRNYPQSQDLRQHVMNAIARELSNNAIRIDKHKTSKRVDAAVADSMCCLGVMQYIRDFERLAKGTRPVVARTNRNKWKEIYHTGARR